MVKSFIKGILILDFIDTSSLILHLVTINPMSHKICYLLPNDSLSQEGLAVKLSAGLLSLTFSEMPELKIIAIRAGHARRGHGAPGTWGTTEATYCPHQEPSA